MFLPFTLFKGNVFEFERFIEPKSKDSVSVRLFENNKKIQYIFTYNYQEGWDVVNRIYRDLNNIFVKDFKTGKWYGTTPNLFLEATYYARTRKTKFDIESFYWNFFEIEKKGTCFAVGNLTEKLDLIKQGKAYLQPITIKGHKEHKYTTIDRHTTFFMPTTVIRKRYDNILKNCNYIKRHILSDNDETELNTLYLGFVFNELAAFSKSKPNRTSNKFGKGDVVLMPKTEYNKISHVEINIFNFFISNNEYKDWLNTPCGILFYPALKNIPHPISACEKLFDKNVLPIKKLVEDISNLNNVTIKEIKNFFLYDDSNLISNTFFTELNKKMQCYGYISLLYIQQ